MRRPISSSSGRSRTCSTPRDEDRRRATGSLVLRAVRSAVHGENGRGFLHARAVAEVAMLPASSQRSMLTRALICAGPRGVNRVALGRVLARYACELEREGQLAEADHAMGAAHAADRTHAETALHAGRLARRLGDGPRALRLYREARALKGGSGHIARMAMVGEAVLSAEPAAALGEVLAVATTAGDHEAAGVAREALCHLAGDEIGLRRLRADPTSIQLT